jgi:hypothetical protein
MKSITWLPVWDDVSGEFACVTQWDARYDRACVELYRSAEFDRAVTLAESIRRHLKGGA